MANIPFIEQVKIQAQVIVPLMKALQAEVGEERAKEIVLKGLRGWGQNIGRQLSTLGTGSSSEKMAAVLPVMQEGEALDIEVLKQTPDAFEFNITGCRYAQFYKELGEPEIGFLFVCAQDFPLTEGFSDDLELVRTQTIMQGSSHCDFRFRRKNKEHKSG